MRRVYLDEYVGNNPSGNYQFIAIFLFGSAVPLLAANIEGSPFIQNLVQIVTGISLFQSRLNSVDFSELDVRCFSLAICVAPIIITVTIGLCLYRWQGVSIEKRRRRSIDVKSNNPPIPVVFLTLATYAILIKPLSNSQGVPLSTASFSAYPIFPIVMSLLAFLWGLAIQSVFVSILGDLKSETSTQ